MDIQNYGNNMIASTDSSEDGMSNEEVEDDRTQLLHYSPNPPMGMLDSGDEGYPQDETASYSSQGSNFSSHCSNFSSSPSVYSSAGSNYVSSYSHSQPNMYEPSSYHNSSSVSLKRKADHVDSDVPSDEYGSFDDAVSSISNSSSIVSSKKKSKKYDFDSCAREVEPNFNVDPKAQAMMKKMGYKKGTGLGRNQQGITAPIEASKQRGRHGIGHAAKQLEPADLVWDNKYEEVSVEEFPVWLECDHLQSLDQSELHDWVKEGPKVMVMDSYNDFCDPDLLSDILESKTVFDDLEGKELLNAVKRSNPFETISNGIFLNRAAMKMANMDRVFDFMFTNPVDRDNRPIIGEMDLLYFADVCAGPGGFSEYVLWRKNWQAKGIGFTLKHCNDFKLDDFLAGTPESFEPYYGAKGDGDVYDPDNVESLTDFVMAKTDNLGVHFMMADGGFSVAGQENIQEIMSKRLYLCQLLIALSIVRTDGHFVCKLFDLFTPFSVGLVYLMYRSFQKICIHKPNTSRPANSERYIICKYKRSDCDAIRSYMFDLNLHFNNLGSNSNRDIVECVPMTEMSSDVDFFDYILNSNNRLGRRQLVHLKKVIAFCRDTKLEETKQNELRQKCLDYWGVPSTARRPDSTSAEAMAAQILKRSSYDFATEAGEEITSEEQLKVLFPSILDWTCIPVGNHNECHFYIGCKNRVLMLRKNGKGWTNLDSKVKLDLSPGTLVYGEIVEEVKGSYRSQTRDKFFHIIDAFQLGKKNIMHRSYATRVQLCKLYAKALHKNWQVHVNAGNYSSSCSPITYPMNLRANDYFELKRLMSIFHRVEIRTNKIKDQEILLGLKNELPQIIRNSDERNSGTSENYFFPVKGILFYKITKNPWTVHYSKRLSRNYYYQKGGTSVMDRPNDINANTVDCFITRRLWTWTQGVGVKRESPKEGVLHMNQFLAFIDKNVMQ
ncbi:cap methyltransferase 1 [Lycorma delicatula]|uniref:cap methyltransferase 1 n=1 Tax=Lycorma delicatula TaxID=130591 RepID=UPI003F51924F